uniref:Bm14804 n=1 Tax=Brugia malayi TaxID=6279 RepID=A0A0J9Y9L0_BRUMA|nr:Bm14804 [Brugia malayi]
MLLAESAKYSQMSASNKNSDVEDYYGYWQPYPNNIRSRRWFQQFEAIKIGGPFCLRAIAACAIAYHVAYYTYQFTAVNPEYRHDLRHVIWLKQKLSVYPSIGICRKEKIENFPEKRSWNNAAVFYLLTVYDFTIVLWLLQFSSLVYLIRINFCLLFKWIQMKQTEWFLKKYPNQYKAENTRTPIISFCCGVGILSVVFVLYNRYCLDARKLPDGEAVDWRWMLYLKKYVPPLRNFGIPYREYKPDDF